MAVQGLVILALMATGCVAEPTNYSELSTIHPIEILQLDDYTAPLYKTMNASERRSMFIGALTKKYLSKPHKSDIDNITDYLFVNNPKENKHEHYSIKVNKGHTLQKYEYNTSAFGNSQMTFNLPAYNTSTGNIESANATKAFDNSLSANKLVANIFKIYKKIEKYNEKGTFTEEQLNRTGRYKKHLLKTTKKHKENENMLWPWDTIGITKWSMTLQLIVITGAMFTIILCLFILYIVAVTLGNLSFFIWKKLFEFWFDN